MKKILAIAILLPTLILGGCATQFGQRMSSFVSAVETIGSSTVSPESIYIAANSFDAVEVSATNYLNLKKCPTNAPFCRDKIATAKLISAIRSGRVARSNARQFLTDHPGQLGSQGLYDALISSTDTVKSILAQYNIGG